MTRVVNLYKEHYDVYIGRAGMGEDGYFGNPFPNADRDRACDDFNEYLEVRTAEDPEYRRRVLGLRGKVLGCFCKPRRCHGDAYVAWLEKNNEC